MTIIQFLEQKDISHIAPKLERIVAYTPKLQRGFLAYWPEMEKPYCEIIVGESENKGRRHKVHAKAKVVDATDGADLLPVRIQKVQPYKNFALSWEEDMEIYNTLVQEYRESGDGSKFLETARSLSMTRREFAEMLSREGKIRFKDGVTGAMVGYIIASISPTEFHELTMDSILRVTGFEIISLPYGLLSAAGACSVVYLKYRSHVAEFSRQLRGRVHKPSTEAL